MIETVMSNFPAIVTTGYGFSLLFHLLGKKRPGDMLLYLAFVFHTIYQLTTGYYGGGLYIFIQVVENPGFLPWAAACIVIVKKVMGNSDGAWDLSLLVVFVLSLIAAFTPKSLAYFGPNKLTVWTVLFFVTNSFAEALFFIGGLQALLFLLGKGNSKSYHWCLVYGFLSHTFSHVAGSIWCFLGWANTFQWVYVHLQSAGIWMYYANYLHLAFRASWGERKRAYYAIVGIVLLLCYKYVFQAI